MLKAIVGIEIEVGDGQGARRSSCSAKDQTEHASASAGLRQRREAGSASIADLMREPLRPGSPALLAVLDYATVDSPGARPIGRMITVGAAQLGPIQRLGPRRPSSSAFIELLRQAASADATSSSFPSSRSPPSFRAGG